MNWYAIHKGPVEKSEGRITPAMVGEMTLPEIMLFMADPKEVTPDGYQHLRDADLEAEWRAWQAMEPLERLRRFQR